MAYFLRRATERRMTAWLLAELRAQPWFTPIRRHGEGVKRMGDLETNYSPGHGGSKNAAARQRLLEYLAANPDAVVEESPDGRVTVVHQAPSTARAVTAVTAQFRHVSAERIEL